MGTLLLLALGAYGYYVYSGAKVGGLPPDPQVGIFGWGDKWRYYFMLDKGKVYKQAGPFKLDDSDAQAYAGNMIAKDFGATTVIRFDYVDGAWRRA
jgi:hypothetical protein